MTTVGVKGLTLCVRDPNEIKRPVTSIAWHPDGPDRMIVSHCVVNFQQRTPDTSLDCYVYRTGSLLFATPVCRLSLLAVSLGSQPVAESHFYTMTMSFIFFTLATSNSRQSNR